MEFSNQKFTDQVKTYTLSGLLKDSMAYLKCLQISDLIQSRQRLSFLKRRNSLKQIKQEKLVALCKQIQMNRQKPFAFELQFEHCRIPITTFSIMNQFTWEYLLILSLKNIDCLDVAFQQLYQLNLPNLEQFNIQIYDSVEFTSKYFELLSRSNWSNLQIFIISSSADIRSKYGDCICITIATGPWKKLHTLQLNFKQVTEKGFAALASLTQLSQLTIRQEILERSQLTMLALGKMSSHLKVLDIPQHQFTRSQFKLFCQNEWPLLEELYLSTSRLQEVEAKYLSRTKMKNLIRFIARFDKMNIQGYRALTHANWNQLQRLQCQNSKLNLFECGRITQSAFNLDDNNLSRQMFEDELQEKMLHRRYGNDKYWCYTCHRLQLRIQD